MALSAKAGAEPPAALAVKADSPCPSREQIIEQLGALWPTTQFDDRATEAVQVGDHGTVVSVTVRGTTKTFDDAARDCMERARLVAVFVGLTLDPPQLEDPEPEPEPPPPEPTTTGAPLQLEAGPWVLWAPSAGTSNQPILGGAALRLLWGAPLGLSVGVAGLFPTTLRYDDAEVRAQWWLPLDAGARLQLVDGPYEIAVELGLTASVLSARGDGLPGAQRQSRLEVGGRGALVARTWWTESLGMYLSLNGLLFPRPYTFVVEPDETLGSTPHVWLGASLGLSVDL